MFSTVILSISISLLLFLLLYVSFFCPVVKVNSFFGLSLLFNGIWMYPIMSRTVKSRTYNENIAEMVRTFGNLKPRKWYWCITHSQIISKIERLERKGKLIITCPPKKQISKLNLGELEKMLGKQNNLSGKVPQYYIAFRVL